MFNGMTYIIYTEYYVNIHLSNIYHNVCVFVYLGERLHVVDGGDGVGDEPGQAEHGADDDNEGQDQQVQVVPATLHLPEPEFFL